MKSLTNAELNRISDRIDWISWVSDRLEDDGGPEARHLDALGDELEALQAIVERSLRVTRIRESGLQLIRGRA